MHGYRNELANPLRIQEFFRSYLQRDAVEDCFSIEHESTVLLRHREFKGHRRALAFQGQVAIRSESTLITFCELGRLVQDCGMVIRIESGQQLQRLTPAQECLAGALLQRTHGTPHNS